MINPNRVHRARAVIQDIGPVSSEVRLDDGAVITAWTDALPDGATVGTVVNIQARFSIVLDSYICKTVRLPRTTKGK